MVCIYCTSKTQVINSRHQKKVNNVWRRRECDECSAVFSTQEAADTSKALRILKNGVLEPFSRDHLFISVFDSLRHRKTAQQDATALTQTIQGKLLPHIYSAKVDRSVVVQVTGSVLERFDKVAATHYRAFHQLKS